MIFDFSTGFRFSKISVECFVHICSCSWSGLSFTVHTVHIRSQEESVGTFDLSRIFAQAVKDSSEEVVFRWTCVLKPNLFSGKKARHNLSSYFFLKA